MPSEPAVRLRGLSEILWRERHLLDLLHFKLEVERMLLEGDRVRWIGHAGREIDVVLDELGHVEIERALLLADVGPALGLSTEPSLEDVVGAAPDPWGALLEGHRRALTTMAADVQRLADENVALLGDVARDTRRRLVRVRGFER